MSYLIQEIQELEAEKREKMNELFPSQHGELEHLTEEIYRLRVEIGKLSKDVKELQEEVACETEQEKTHCDRCEEAFHELNEESGVREGWCSYCEQVGQWNE